MLSSGLAPAAVEWHSDLDTAQAAARISQRPVLAVFVASMELDTRAFESVCLGTPEAEAVLVTCFEPVRIDVVARPELARAAGVTHVPSACVLAADDTPLAHFAMPESPAAFVTAALLAARRASELAVGPARVDAAQPVATASPVAVTGAAAEPPRGSLARVTEKVRELSAFARNRADGDATASPVGVASAAGADTAAAPGSPPTAPSQPATAVPQPLYAAPQPAVAAATPAWPSEPAAAAPTSPSARPSLEPAAGDRADIARSAWLDAARPPAVAAAPQPAPQPAPADARAAAQLAASAAPPATAAPAPRAPDAKPESWQTKFIAAIQKPFGLGPKAADPPTLPPALPQGSLAAAAQAAAAVDPPPAPDPYGSMPLGLEGYCPVTLVDRGAWKEGRAQWGARHRGRTYLFAGADEQRTFLADPDRYAPALSGDDPVLALDRGSSTPGQRRYGVTYRARMYLFASAETRQAFTADPDRYAARIVVAERTPAAAGGTRTY